VFRTLIVSTLTVSRLKQKYLFLPSQIRDPYLYYLLHNPPEGIDVALKPVAKPKEKEKDKKSKSGRTKRRREETPEDAEEVLIPSTIIFAQRCATAHLLHLLLNELEIPSVPLHSHLTQPQRLLSLARFRAGEVPVLVTTDVGSRGLDIPEVAMVINWDCPRRSDDYIHRVGRTARAGRGGVAVTIVTERDVDLVKSIEDEIGVELSELELPEETVLEKLNQVSLARRVATMVSLASPSIFFYSCHWADQVGDARLWLWGEASNQQSESHQEGSTGRCEVTRR
jgi:ATP-dependent RNA helicase DDX49/DBP8